MNVRRRSLEIPGVTHGKAPIPMASQIGNIVYSSAIMGKDCITNTLPDQPQIELACLFQNVRAVMQAAGGSTDDIIRMSVYLKSNDIRALFNEVWLKMFPNEHDRPARHITLVDLPNNMNVQVEIVAVIQ
ncbi:MAG: RidA family protein [Paenibacillaceae bacterium]